MVCRYNPRHLTSLERKQVGSWTIDRNCLVTTPELATIKLELLRKVLDALKNARVLAKSDSKVSSSKDGHSGVTLRNVVNLIWSKHIEYVADCQKPYNTLKGIKYQLDKNSVNQR